MSEDTIYALESDSAIEFSMKTPKNPLTQLSR